MESNGGCAVACCLIKRRLEWLLGGGFLKHSFSINNVKSFLFFLGLPGAQKRGVRFSQPGL